MEAFVQEVEPVLADGIRAGDFWIRPSTGAAKLCLRIRPAVVFVQPSVGGHPPDPVADVTSASATAVPAGGTGAAAGAWDTAANRNTAITNINNMVTLVNELKTQVNSILARLRTMGICRP